MNYSFCNYIAFAQKSALNFNPEKINKFFFFWASNTNKDREQESADL